METLDWVRFHVPLDTKQVTSETMFPANVSTEKTKLNKTKNLRIQNQTDLH